MILPLFSVSLPRFSDLEVTLPRFSDLGIMKPLFSAALVQERITERGRLWYLHLRTVRPPLDAATISHERGSGFTVSLPRFSDLGMMKPLFSVSLPGFSDLGMMMMLLFSVSLPRFPGLWLQKRNMRLLHLTSQSPLTSPIISHRISTAFHSVLAEVLGPGDDEAAFLSLLKVGVLCHDIVAAHAQCKDEASEYTGFEGHGNADTPELKSVPDWLEEKLAKTATEEH